VHIPLYTGRLIGGRTPGGSWFAFGARLAILQFGFGRLWCQACNSAIRLRSPLVPGLQFCNSTSVAFGARLAILQFGFGRFWCQACNSAIRLRSPLVPGLQFCNSASVAFGARLAILQFGFGRLWCQLNAFRLGHHHSKSTISALSHHRTSLRFNSRPRNKCCVNRRTYVVWSLFEVECRCRICP
jgi:hypothetical protein